jgi:DNA-binding MarR family transcriptional regulator
MYITGMNNQGEAAPMHALLHAAGVLQDRLERACEEAGVTSAKYGPLSVLLQADEPLPLSELANRLRCVRSNMTQLVDRLETDGLVRRTSDPDDRRVVRAELTPLGRERAVAASRLVSKVQKEFTAALSAADRDAIDRILTVLG